MNSHRAMHRTKVFLTLSAFFLLQASPHPATARAKAASPQAETNSPETQMFIAALPGGVLTPELVLSRSRVTSETYAAIQALGSVAEAARLRTESALRPRLTADLTKLDNRLEPSNPFEPNRIEAQALRTGLSTSFLTGTALDFGVRLGQTSLGFPPNPAGAIGPIDFDEVRFDLALRQNLWRDSFGVSSRLGNEIGFMAADVQRQQRRAEIESWALGIINRFYAAWLAQNQVRDARETLERRIRIEKITRLRLARGTAERPDVLESESARVAAELDLRAATERLQEAWLTLAIALDIPPETAAKVDPANVPLALDAADTETAQLCRSVDPRAGSAALARARAEERRATAELKRAELEHKPDLALTARFASNGIDDSLRAGFQDVSRFRHPLWEVGLRFEMPLGLYEAEARRKEASAQSLRATAQAAALADQEKVTWEIRCQELSRRLADLGRLRENSQRQSDRARLEEQRFGIGRIRLNDVARAEDEALFSRIRVQQEEVALRRALWSIRELTGKIPETVEAMQ